MSEVFFEEADAVDALISPKEYLINRARIWNKNWWRDSRSEVDKINGLIKSLM